MSITEIIIALVVAYIVIGFTESRRVWKAILDADKVYRQSIESLRSSRNLNPKSKIIAIELYEIQKDHEDLRKLLDRKDAYWLILLVYLSAWPAMILKGDGFYDTHNDH